jgi:uncharacterized Zn finger protein
MGFYGFRPYVPVAKRRLLALREMEKLKKKGRVVSPVVIEGLKIAQSFWGKAWCDNLERYSDFESRLPRGRTYVRNGSVIDLQVGRGKVEALVSGSEIYKVKVDIAVAAPERWTAICRDCAGSVGSLVELLQGKLSKNVMERVCREADGLFPAPGEIKMSCSCPDWAGMCKHVAATLYGVGARLDFDPDVLFTLRGVDRAQLVSTVGADLPLTRGAEASERVLEDDDVAALFGIDIAAPAAPPKGPQGRKAKTPDHGPAMAVAAPPVRTTKQKTAGRKASPVRGKTEQRRKKTAASPADPAGAKATVAPAKGKPLGATKPDPVRRKAKEPASAPERNRRARFSLSS